MDEYTLIFLFSRCIRCAQKRDCWESVRFASEMTLMLHLSSWMTTLPMMLIGMTGILLVIGFLVLVVMALNCLTHRK